MVTYVYLWMSLYNTIDKNDLETSMHDGNFNRKSVSLLCLGESFFSSILQGQGFNEKVSNIYCMFYDICTDCSGILLYLYMYVMCMLVEQT